MSTSRIRTMKSGETSMSMKPNKNNSSIKSITSTKTSGKSKTILPSWRSAHRSKLINLRTSWSRKMHYSKGSKKQWITSSKKTQPSEPNSMTLKTNSQPKNNSGSKPKMNSSSKSIPSSANTTTPKTDLMTQNTSAKNSRKNIPMPSKPSQPLKKLSNPYKSNLQSLSTNWRTPINRKSTNTKHKSMSWRSQSSNCWRLRTCSTRKTISSKTKSAKNNSWKEKGI